jgi:hypothetical protein
MTVHAIEHESLGSELLKMVVARRFCAHGGALRSLGLHKLRGLDQTHELFVPAADDHF